MRVFPGLTQSGHLVVRVRFWCDGCGRFERIQMRRRKFLALLAGAAAGGSNKVGAQQQASTLRRIGALWSFSETNPDMQARLTQFNQGLVRLGWLEGKTYTSMAALGGRDRSLRVASESFGCIQTRSDRRAINASCACVVSRNPRYPDRVRVRLRPYRVGACRKSVSSRRQM